MTGKQGGEEQGVQKKWCEGLIERTGDWKP